MEDKRNDALTQGPTSVEKQMISLMEMIARLLVVLQSKLPKSGDDLPPKKTPSCRLRPIRKQDIIGDEVDARDSNGDNDAAEHSDEDTSISQKKSNTKTSMDDLKIGVKIDILVFDGLVDAEELVN